MYIASAVASSFVWNVPGNIEGGTYVFGISQSGYVITYLLLADDTWVQRIVRQLNYSPPFGITAASPSAARHNHRNIAAAMIPTVAAIASSTISTLSSSPISPTPLPPSPIPFYPILAQQQPPFPAVPRNSSRTTTTTTTTTTHSSTTRDTTTTVEAITPTKKETYTGPIYKPKPKTSTSTGVGPKTSIYREPGNFYQELVPNEVSSKNGMRAAGVGTMILGVAVLFWAGMV